MKKSENSAEHHAAICKKKQQWKVQNLPQMGRLSMFFFSNQGDQSLLPGYPLIAFKLVLTDHNYTEELLNTTNSGVNEEGEEKGREGRGRSKLCKLNQPDESKFFNWLTFN